MRILLIDDDPAIRELVAQFLSLSAKYDVHAVQSARDALVEVRDAEVPFDCFLIDIQMPGVDGVTLIKFIRENEEYEDTPIVMLTAMQEKAYLDRAFSAGATDYVTKPFVFADLHGRLEGAMQRASEDAAKQGEGVPLGAEAPLEQIALDDPIPLPEIVAAIDYGEFENYLRQLMSQRLYRATAIVVKIGAVNEAHAVLTTGAFRALLSSVARAIDKSILAGGGLLTYRGGGVFFCIPENRILGRRKAIQQALNKCLQRDHPGAARLTPNLLVGEQVSLAQGSGVSLLDCMTKAVDSLDKETTGLRELLDASRRFLKAQCEVRNGQPNEQHHTEMLCEA